MRPDRRPLIEGVLARDQSITFACVAGAAVLAWTWLAGMPAGHAMPGDVWSLSYLGASFLMWALMMVAMMLPSATPMILLYARFARSPGGAGRGGAALFAFTYVAVWTGFSAAATVAQAAAIDVGLVSAMGLAIGDARLAGALMIAAGLYQLTPLKRACLAQCRSPLSFLTRLWRPGPAGAVRLGLAHGLYCLGCCWALMLLLFVGGVMNLAWIALLAGAVLVEKLAPPWLRASSVIAAALIGGGVWLLVRG